MPNRLDWLQWWYLFYLPMEVPVLAALLLLPGRARRWCLLAATVIVSAGLIFRLSDMGAFMVFARPFNPVLDLYLLSFGFNLLQTSIGLAGAVLVSVLALMLVVAIIVLTYAALRHVQTVLLQVPARAAYVAVGSVFLLWAVTYASGWSKSSRYFVDQLLMHGDKVVTSLREIETVRAGDCRGHL